MENTVFPFNIAQITKKQFRLEYSKWPFEQPEVEANIFVL